MKHGVALLLGLIALIWSPPASSRPLIAEISSHDIVIHSAFDGTELLLFGTRNGTGDIIVVVRGARRNAVVRKKEQIAGIWVNRASETFDAIPAFYTVAASRPYDQIMKSVYFEALQIGYDEAIQPFSDNALPQPQHDERTNFASALLQNLRTARLYHPDILPITFVGGGLFRATIPFPDNTPTGSYSVEVYLVSDGEITATHTTPIHVYKSGLDAFVYGLAHESPKLYGVIAIMVALFGGVLAIRLFHRV